MSLKKKRLDLGLYKIEGFKLLKEALISGSVFDFVVCSQSSILDLEKLSILKALFEKGISVFMADDFVLANLSELEASDGLLAVLKIQDQKKIETLFNNDSFIVLDGVSDPGNVGTIMRVADWFGLSNLVLGVGCADPLNIKTLRASMGSFFRINVYDHIELKNFLIDCRRHNIVVAVADSNADSYIESVDLSLQRTYAFVFGGESHGIDRSIIDNGDMVFAISGYGRCESLNVGVATGIVLHTFFIKNH